jgi:hypothetical protein
LPWANLEGQVTASPSLVSLAKDACSWLKSKSWLLNSKGMSRAKLANILLLATLSFKLPAKASMAIHSVAFLLSDHTDEILSSTIMDQISDKLINKINAPIIKLHEAFVASKSFLDATAQKQAAELLALQELIKQPSDLVKS